MEQTAINPVVVHGGGPQAEKSSSGSGSSSVRCGLRVTHARTIEIVEMVLGGSINKQIVGILCGRRQGRGLCGKRPQHGWSPQGQPPCGRPRFLRISRRSSISVSWASPTRSTPPALKGPRPDPAPAPLATSTEGLTYNVNADTFAGAIAGALKAKWLLLLTDVPGVLDKSKKLIKQLSSGHGRRHHLGGMIPKVETSEAGVLRAW